MSESKNTIDYINECMPTIHKFSHKLNLEFSRDTEREDLVQEGVIAVLKGIKTYDGRVKFYVYMYKRIHGAMIDFLRKIYKTRDIKNYRFLSLENTHKNINPDSGETRLLDLIPYNKSNILDDIIEQEKKDIVMDKFIEIVDNLPERERFIAMEYFMGSLTMLEMSQVVGLTESRICQITLKLREELKDKINEIYDLNL